MTKSSTENHNDLVKELLELIIESTNGVNSSACVIVESLVVGIIALSSQQLNIDAMKLTNTFFNGVKGRLITEFNVQANLHS